MSQATAIRDAMAALLVGLLPSYTEIRKVSIRQLQPDDIPCITVVRGDEEMMADEDATAGPPHFIHAATFHISLLRGFDDPLALDTRIDADADAVLNRLLRDPALNVMFEGITSIRRTRNFPQSGETYFVELRLEMTVQYRSFWEPIIPDDFTTVALELVPNDGTGINEVDTVFTIPQ